MPTATGLGKRATRSSISCPSADNRSASAAEVRRTNSSMSAPAMKFSGFPEKNATACTLVSSASAAKQAMNSSFTAREITLTGWPSRSSTTVAMPSLTSHVSAGATRDDGGASVATTGAPGPSRIPSHPARRRKSIRTARRGASSHSIASSRGDRRSRRTGGRSQSIRPSR